MYVVPSLAGISNKDICGIVDSVSVKTNATPCICHCAYDIYVASLRC